MAAYYNEFDPFAAAWLRNLISTGHIAPGDVDERSITEVKPDDIKRYTQCHFFAGIGGWSYALRLAGLPDDRPVWTGSCPCQPFSTAGKQKGKSDERHLWPVWFNLIRECKPSIVFGEQVASAITHGWWDDVANDMEAEGYSCGAAVLPACSVGAPHKRDRLWFVANTGGQESGWLSSGKRQEIPAPRFSSKVSSTLGNSKHDGHFAVSQSGSNGEAIQHYTQRQDSASESEGAGGAEHVADTDSTRPQGHRRHEQQHGEEGWKEPDGLLGETDIQWVKCPDGKARPVKSGLCLLANGIPNRVGKLRGYGNAIVAPVAAEFIKATM